MPVLSTALMALIVALGATTQRVTGMGFALVASPLLVLLLGGGVAIPLVQVLSLVTATMVLAQTWRDVEIKKAVLLFIPALVGIVPGVWLANRVSDAWLQIIIGAVVIIALVALIASERARIFKGTPGAIGAGFLSGFMNVTAGVGGPPVVLYSLSTEWQHAKYVATIQLYFMGLNIASLIGRGWPEVGWPQLLIATACVIAGSIIGNRLTTKVSAELARKLVITVALVGSLATVIQGTIKL